MREKINVACTSVGIHGYHGPFAFTCGHVFACLFRGLFRHWGQFSPHYDAVIFKNRGLNQATVEIRLGQGALLPSYNVNFQLASQPLTEKK